MAEMTNPQTAAELDELQDAPKRLVTIMAFIDRWGVLFLVLLMGVLSYLSQPDFFLSERNLGNIFRQNSFYALLALGQFIVIVTAGIDLSVGSVMALAAMTAAVLAHRGQAWPVVFIAPFLVGLAVGTINGLGLTKLHMPHPFIMTLGMLFIARGATNLISGGVPISGLPDQVRFLGADDIPGTPIPMSLLVIVVTYAAVWLFLQHGRSGRHIYAIGGNPQAARVSGVRVDATLVLAYALCGLMAGFAGLLLAGRTNSGFPAAGTGDELYAIAAVIIGGASLAGGRGSVAGTLTGALLLAVLVNGLALLAAGPFATQMLFGTVTIGAVVLDRYTQRKRGML